MNAIMMVQSIVDWLLRLIVNASLADFATVTLAIAACLGLRTWRQQLVGQYEFDLARRAIRQSIIVRDSLWVARNPIAFPAEVFTALKEAGFSDDQAREKMMTHDAEVAQFTRRFRPVEVASQELEAIEVEVEACFGGGMRKIITALRECVKKYWVASLMHLDTQKPENKGIFDAAQANEWESIRWRFDHDPTREPFQRRVNEAVKRIEEALRPHLKR